MKHNDQAVIACIEDPSSAPAVIAYAQHFAHHLREKRIILLNVSPHSKADWLAQYNLPFVAMQGSWRTAVEGFHSAFNAILAVTAVNPSAPRSSITHPRTLLRTFRPSKIAYLCVNTQLQPPSPQLQTLLTLDHHRESKQKLIWASYLARFLHADLTFALPQYRDPDLSRRQQNNLQFANKIFSSLQPPITFATQPTPYSTLSNPDLTTLSQLQHSNTPLQTLIALATDLRAFDPLDFLLGPPEQRLLSHPSRTPILFLNQRDDLYVLCD